MNKYKPLLLATAGFMTNIVINPNAIAANIYVDKTLSANCTSGNYSTQSRTCSGSDGKAYTTIQQAVNNMKTSEEPMNAIASNFG